VADVPPPFVDDPTAGVVATYPGLLGACDKVFSTPEEAVDWLRRAGHLRDGLVWRRSDNAVLYRRGEALRGCGQA
jgi:hypothetical protein